MTIKNCYIYIAIIISGVFLPETSLAQISFSRTPKSDFDTLLVRVESGGSVSFRINSMNKYNEGVEYNDWSRIAVYFIDEDDEFRTWNLQYKATTLNIIGDSGIDLYLDLDYLTIEAKDGGGGNDLSGYVQPEKELDSEFQTLIENAPQGNFSDNKIIITYRFGKGGNILLGEPPGYYVVDIVFEVTAN